MKQKLFFPTLFLAICLQQTASATPDEAEQHQRQAAVLAQDFMGTLKPILKKAMTEKGPVHAINVCSVEAPKIAQNLSKHSGWNVKRVSLKARNPNAKPDKWESQQLVMFDALQQQGVKPSLLNTWQLKKNQFRYMQAQTTEGLCLVCHGQNIAPDVKKALAQHYPRDGATGYSLGEVRGAISLSKNTE